MAVPTLIGTHDSERTKNSSHNGDSLVEAVELKRFAALLQNINHHETGLVNRRKLYTAQEDGKQPSLQCSFCCKILFFFFSFFPFLSSLSKHSA